MNSENVMAKLRKKKNLSQTELAEKLGVSRGYVSLLENKERNPSLAMYEKIENILGIEIKGYWT